MRKRRQPMPITVPSLPVKKAKLKAKLRQPEINVTQREQKRARSKSSSYKPVPGNNKPKAALSKIRLPQVPAKINSQFAPSSMAVVTSG